MKYCGMKLRALVTYMSTSKHLGDLQNNLVKNFEDKYHKCGIKGHFVTYMSTSKHLVDLY